MLRPASSFPAASYSPVPPSGTVPSALRGLTAVFGMGTGVTPSLWRPERLPSDSPDGLSFRPTEYVGIFKQQVRWTGSLRCEPRSGDDRDNHRRLSSPPEWV